MKIEEFISHPAPEDFVYRFARVPAAVRRDPYCVGLPSLEQTSRMFEIKWPAPRNFFMASDDHRPVAILSANLSTTVAERGFIGHYECDLQHPLANEAARRLIGEAEDFLQRNGVRSVLAPVNHSTWFSYRFLKPGSASPHYAWEPIQPPEYYSPFVEAGYSEDRTYSSIAQCRYEKMIEAFLPGLDRALQRGFTFRSFDGSHLEQEVTALHRITMNSFSGSYLFEPLALKAFRDLYYPMLEGMNLGLSFFLLNPAGAEEGFIFAFLDNRYPDHCVVKTLALIDTVRGEGLSNALVCHCLREAQSQGATRVVHALIRDDAQSRSYARYAPIDWQHDYMLMGKTLR